MFKNVSVFFSSLLVSLTLFAAPCPNLTGKFEAKVGPVLNQIEIKQNACESFEIIRANSEGDQSRRLLIPDGVERTLFHSGRIVHKVTAQVVVIKIGNAEVTALREDVAEEDRYLETTVYEQNHYFVEEGPTYRNLVERKDIYDNKHEYLGRIYIGYVNVDRP